MVGTHLSDVVCVLRPENRILNMSVVRTVLLSWKEATTKLEGRSKHMPTCQTFDDAIIAVEGIVLFIFIVAADNPDEHIMSWLQALHIRCLCTAIRISLYMKTKLCCKDVLVGMDKSNQS